MKTSVSFSDFCDAFRNADRNENFSYEGKRALFDYLDNYEEECGVEVELDVIAFCCEYSEDDVDTIINSYSIDVSDAEDDEEKAEIVAEYLNDHTLNLGQLPNGSFVYAQF
jgi:hypothetical protein